MRLEGTPLEEMDPRFKPGWDPNWWVDNHPLGLQRLAYTTVLSRDLDRAARVYTDVLGGTNLGSDDSDLTGTRNVNVLLGDTVVQLAMPTQEGTLAAQDMATNGEIHHAAAFKVVDLDRAEKYLTSKNIAVLDRDATTLLTDPATTHGVPFRWTTADVAGDPRG